MATTDEKVRSLELLYRVGIALSAERNKDRLLEMILLEAKNLCNADGGTLYLRTDDDHLKFAIMRTDSLGIALGGSTGAPITFPPVPMMDLLTGQPNHKNVASAAALLRRSVNIPDAYHAAGFDFSGTKAFDQKNNYRSKSFLAIPLVNGEDRVIGVLQLLNARDPVTSELISFADEHQRIVEALRSGGNGYVQSAMVRAFEIAQRTDSLASAFRKLGGRGLRPAHERLDAHHAAGREVDLRLMGDDAV